MEQRTQTIIITALIIMGILSMIGIFTYANHVYYEIKIENFQATIDNLSEEQKCLHICSFNFPGAYFENYKFCVEKCDRISERSMECKT